MPGWRPSSRFGFVIFEGVPTTPGTVLKVGATFGFTRETNFGALFDVRSTPNATDLAYTSVALDPHTDNPYRAPVPGIQLLHCLVNETSGGLSTLVDGFAVAEALRAADPAAFAVLSSTPVRFKYLDADTELTASAPPIELDVTARSRQSTSARAWTTCRCSRPRNSVPTTARAASSTGACARATSRSASCCRAVTWSCSTTAACCTGVPALTPRKACGTCRAAYIDIDGPRSLYRVLRRRRASLGSVRRSA